MAGIANMRKKLMPLQTGGGVRAPDVGAEIPNISNNDPYASYKVRGIVVSRVRTLCMHAPGPALFCGHAYSLPFPPVQICGISRISSSDPAHATGQHHHQGSSQQEWASFPTCHGCRSAKRGP